MVMVSVFDARLPRTHRELTSGRTASHPTRTVAPYPQGVDSAAG